MTTIETTFRLAFCNGRTRCFDGVRFGCFCHKYSGLIWVIQLKDFLDCPRYSFRLSISDFLDVVCLFIRPINSIVFRIAFALKFFLENFLRGNERLMIRKDWRSTSSGKKSFNRTINSVRSCGILLGAAAMICAKRDAENSRQLLSRTTSVSRLSIVLL